MSGSYVQCPECGKRALRIATRCPHCGHEFTSAAAPEPRRPLDSRGYLTVLAVAATAAVLIALGILVGGRIRKTSVMQAPSASAAIPDTTARFDTAMASASSRASAPERRYARTWTNVRTRRSTGADVAAVLLPGDTVLVDSLQRGWWRVTLEDSVLGYVHQSTLQMEPPR